MPADADILAVIPFYQRRDQLDRCLAALAASTRPVTPFVHDNSTENIGFTKAINRGLRAAIARGDTYCLLINQDCYVEPDAVATLVEFMEAHPHCAIAGPMQLVPDDPDLILSAGGVRVHPTARVRRGGRRSAGNFAQSIPVVYVNGACMFVRLAAVMEFGLLDESMVLFCSDVDWSLTARARGWETWYCADARVLHEKGVSEAAAANPPEVREQMDRDGDHFRRKWIGSVLYHQLDRMPGETRLSEPVERAMQTAAAHVEAGRLVEAEVIWRDVLAAEPNNVAALRMMGMLMLTRHNNAALAHDYFKAATAAAPSDAELRLLYAMALDGMRRTDDAVREYAHAARLEEGSLQRLSEIAARIEALGRPSEAAAVRAKIDALQKRGGADPAT